MKISVTFIPNQAGKQLHTGEMDEFMQGVIKGATKAGGSGVTIESSKLDKAAKSYQLNMVVPTNGMKVHAGLVGFFGRQGVVQICTYSTDASFPEADTKYQEVAKSFHFDPAYAFDDSENYAALIAASVVGLVVVIAVLLAVVFAVRSSRKKPAAIPFAG